MISTEMGWEDERAESRYWWRTRVLQRSIGRVGRCRKRNASCRALYRAPRHPDSGVQFHSASRHGVAGLPEISGSGATGLGGGDGDSLSLCLSAGGAIEFGLGEIGERFEGHAFDPAFLSRLNGARPVSSRDGIALLHLARVYVRKPHGFAEGNHPTEGRYDV